jgi:hypothetical protein
MRRARRRRRTSRVVPENIAEGSCRGGTAPRRGTYIPLGSASELEYYLVLAKDLYAIERVDDVASRTGTGADAIALVTRRQRPPSTAPLTPGRLRDRRPSGFVRMDARIREGPGRGSTYNRELAA